MILTRLREAICTWLAIRRNAKADTSCSLCGEGPRLYPSDEPLFCALCFPTYFRQPEIRSAFAGHQRFVH